MSYNVYLVEDEANLNTLLSTYLKQEGWEVKSFLNGSSALQAAADKPHLWILDIMLPDMDGYELLKQIKKIDEQIPVIYISARDEDLDRIIGLELGSDDYLAKPFLPKELVIRSKKILKRVYERMEHEQTAFSYGPYTIEERERTVTEDGKQIPLTSKEYDLLLYLLKHIGQALGREQILFHVWGEDYFGSDRVVDDLIRRVRKKCPELHLETIYGYGYRTVKHFEK
ncbi:response regulator transcription factor [Metabacillus sp. GX 13764]|uniref:response regulator transcription factor n=1 Tax=Metabacillus kandeliae TaxID=2900151 RepID=UPI001E427B90|nr:response regulator transcription factor [Metabacillus kandeliae]